MHAPPQKIHTDKAKTDFAFHAYRKEIKQQKVNGKFTILNS